MKYQSQGELVLKPTAEKIEEVVISVNNSVKSSVAIQRQIEKSVVVKSGTSKEDMKRSGDGNAGQAAKRIPGISIVGGKYVFIRGIGDRYNKTTINGVDIPGLDPDRNSIQMDLFPSNIIDNMSIHSNTIIKLNFCGPFSYPLPEITIILYSPCIIYKRIYNHYFILLKCTNYYSEIIFIRKKSKPR